MKILLLLLAIFMGNQVYGAPKRPPLIPTNKGLNVALEDDVIFYQHLLRRKLTQKLTHPIRRATSLNESKIENSEQNVANSLRKTSSMDNMMEWVKSLQKIDKNEIETMDGRESIKEGKYIKERRIDAINRKEHEKESMEGEKNTEKDNREKGRRIQAMHDNINRMEAINNRPIRIEVINQKMDKRQFGNIRRVRKFHRTGKSGLSKHIRNGHFESEPIKRNQKSELDNQNRKTVSTKRKSEIDEIKNKKKLKTHHLTREALFGYEKMHKMEKFRRKIIKRKRNRLKKKKLRKPKLSIVEEEEDDGYETALSELFSERDYDEQPKSPSYGSPGTLARCRSLGCEIANRLIEMRKMCEEPIDMKVELEGENNEEKSGELEQKPTSGERILSIFGVVKEDPQIILKRRGALRLGLRNVLCHFYFYYYHREPPKAFEVKQKKVAELTRNEKSEIELAKNNKEKSEQLNDKPETSDEKSEQGAKEKSENSELEAKNNGKLTELKTNNKSVQSELIGSEQIKRREEKSEEEIQEHEKENKKRRAEHFHLMLIDFKKIKIRSHDFGTFDLILRAPFVFRVLRNIVAQQLTQQSSISDHLITIEDLIGAVASGPFRKQANQASSGATFLRTGDKRFMIKSMDAREAQFFEPFAEERSRTHGQIDYFIGGVSDYYEYLRNRKLQHKVSLLPRYHAFFDFIERARKHPSRQKYIMFSNVFHPKFPEIHYKFDFKGASMNRKIMEDENEDPKSKTYRDLDFFRYSDEDRDGSQVEGLFRNRICINPEDHEWLSEVLDQDTLFLEQHNIMDYSLLMGIHFLETNEWPEDEELPPGAIRAMCNNCKDPKTKNYVNGQKLLINIGIIDTLQTYNLARYWEDAFKSTTEILFKKDGYLFPPSTRKKYKPNTVKNPHIYRLRFVEAMTSIVFRNEECNLKKEHEIGDQRSQISEENVENYEFIGPQLEFLQQKSSKIRDSSLNPIEIPENFLKSTKNESKLSSSIERTISAPANFEEAL